MKGRTSKKTISKAKSKPAKKTVKKIATKPKTKKIITAKTSGMNTFEQCVVLAAIVNQQRNIDKKFLFIPLPDINSSALAPLRELLSQYDFTAADIMKAAHDILHSKAFKECFALHDHIKKDPLLHIKKTNAKDIMHELIELSGPEAKKLIYMAEKDSHDIQKTTLEKHALKMGFIEPHLTTSEPFKQNDHHKKIIIKLNYPKPAQTFSTQRFSGKQHRGRG